MNSRKLSSKNIFILLVEAQDSVSILIERCFHESSRLTDIVTHLLSGPETPLDGDYLVNELQRKRYDCVLMDLALPNNNDGISLSKIVQQRVDQAPAIILFGDNISPELRDQALAAGATALLDKRELNPESLRKVVDVAVGVQQATKARE